MSIFDNLKKAEPVEVFALVTQYNADTHPDRTDLGIGEYRNDEGLPWVLPVVRRVEIQIASDEALKHEYLPGCGNHKFSDAATKLLLGEDSQAILDKRAFGIQTLAATGALRLGADFLTKKMGRSVFYISVPTYMNFENIFFSSGFQICNTYRYWNPQSRGIDFEGLLTDLNIAPERSVIVLQANGHNPTGYDPTNEQWKQIAEVMATRNLFPFFDCAYQGFTSGDPNLDAWPVRYFVEHGFELLAAQSFAKSFGLYNERIGNLVVVQKSKATTEAIRSHFTLLIRGSYSNPPLFGSRIVMTILNDPKLREEWMECLKIMSGRNADVRQKLRAELVALKTPGSWEHLTKQIGMFSYTELTERQVKILIQQFHIYLLKCGRINVCGLNSKNIVHVARAIHTAVTRAVG